MATKRHILLDTYAEHTFLGSGTYGYVYSPMFPCGDKPDYDELPSDKEKEHIVSTLVSKLCDLDEGRKEWENGELVIAAIESPKTVLEEFKFKSYKFGVYAQSHCAMVPDRARDRSVEGIKDFEASKLRFEKSVKGNYKIAELLQQLASVRLDQKQKKGILNGTRIAVLQMEKADGCVDSVNFKKSVLSKHAIRQWLNGIDNVILGLMKMHTKELHHFDVKPGNLLYFGSATNPTTIKMCDFGSMLKTEYVNARNCAAVSLIWPNWPPLSKLLFKIINMDIRTNELITEAARLWIGDYEIFLAKNTAKDYKQVQLMQGMFHSYNMLKDERVCIKMVRSFLKKFASKEDRLKNLFDAVDMYGIALTLSRMGPFFHVKEHKAQFRLFLKKCIFMEYTDMSFYIDFHNIMELFAAAPAANPSIWTDKSTSRTLLERSPVSRFLATANVQQFLCS